MNTIDITIEGMAFGGKGIARHDGKVIFVAGGIEGDHATVSIVKEEKKYCDARIEKLITPSPHRGISSCPHSDLCGGCDYQGIPYEKQLAWKKQFVKSALQRIGKLEGHIDFPISASPRFLNYRNRVFLRARFSPTTGLQVGYFQRGSRDFVAIEACAIADSPINQWIMAAKQLNSPFTQNISFRVEVQVLPAMENRLVLTLHPSDENVSWQKLVDLFASMPGVHWVGLKTNAHRAQPFLFDRAENLNFYSSPGQFQQVNLDHNHIVREKVQAIVTEKNPRQILDLFCGSGNFSLGLAAPGRTIHGIEFSHRAIEIARHNAKQANLENFTYESGDCARTLQKWIFAGKQFDLIIADPPREGMAETVPLLRQLAPKTLIYISCDPATLARDLGLLTRDYRVENIAAFDFFPNTYHVETLVVLAKET